MTCDEIRELLPEHLLGSLDEVTDASVRRHLRGCAACRDERAPLEDGLGALAAATHDRTPPEELREHVLGVLDEEWAQNDRPRSVARRGVRTWFAAAAAVLVLVAVLGLWGGRQARRADLAQADAASYRTLLGTLGGRDFHVGRVHGSGETDLWGEVLLYEGDSAEGWSSWGVLIVHAPGTSGAATATLLGTEGDTQELPELRFSSDGEAWILFALDDEATRYDRVTVTAPDGGLIGTGEIQTA
jgi:hypothetical protein